MIRYDLDPAFSAAENASAVGRMLFIAKGCVEPTGDDYRAAMALLDATRSELAARAGAADAAAAKARSAA